MLSSGSRSPFSGNARTAFELRKFYRLPRLFEGGPNYREPFPDHLKPIPTPAAPRSVFFFLSLLACCMSFSMIRLSFLFRCVSAR
jgi:hypothetical protein